MSTGRLFISRIAALLVAIMCLAVVASGLTIWKLRSDAIESAQERAGGLATLLARQTTLSVRTVDLVLEDVNARVASFAPADGDQFAAAMKRRDTYDFLITRLAKLPQTEVINIADASGQLVASTRSFPPPDINIADRDFFLHFSAGPDTALFIGEPVFSKLTGTWTMYFVHRLESADGQFLGVALVGARPSAFMGFYDAIGDIPGVSSLLLRKDGAIFLRHPDQVERAGQKMPQQSEFYSVLAAGGGYYRSPGVFDNIDRWVAVRPLDQYPLVVDVAISEATILAAWRQSAAIIVSGVILAIGIMTLLLRLVFAGYSKLLAAHALLREREGRLAEKTQEISVANLRFETALSNMRQGLAMFDADGRIVIHNRVYAELYGLASEQIRPGSTLDDILEMRIANGMYTIDGPEAYARRHRNHLTYEGPEIDHLRDGRYVTVTHQRMADGGWVATHEDVTERQTAAARLAYMAHHDALTSLANRSLFLEHIAALGRREAPDARFAILLLDLDQFKAVNDTLGHAAGDVILWNAAARLQQSIGPRDLGARLGGDEFAVAMDIDPDAGESTVAAMAEKLMSIICEPYFYEDNEMKIGVSIGAAISSGGRVDPADIMRHADLALYRAKSNGRNCCRLFAPSMEDEARSRRELAYDFDAALAAGQIEVFYQPIVATATREVCAMEALARWRHPVRGFVSPEIFVPLAEENGCVHRLGELVLRRACLDAAAWPASVKISVNVSPKQLGGNRFIESVRAALDNAGIPASRLDLEITECVSLDDDARNLSILRALRDMGVAIVLDDFGSGYSSLSYLNRFPFDKIKIDRTFIEGLGERAGADAIVVAATTIANAIGAETTAEGVETEAQCAMLRAAHVTQMQGYLLGMPSPADHWRFIDGHAVCVRPSVGRAA